jgi:hypothetical protein
MCHQERIDRENWFVQPTWCATSTNSLVRCCYMWSQSRISEQNENRIRVSLICLVLSSWHEIFHTIHQRQMRGKDALQFLLVFYCICGADKPTFYIWKKLGFWTSSIVHFFLKITGHWGTQQSRGQLPFTRGQKHSFWNVVFLRKYSTMDLILSSVLHNRQNPLEFIRILHASIRTANVTYYSLFIRKHCSMIHRFCSS